MRGFTQPRVFHQRVQRGAGKIQPAKLTANPRELSHNTQILRIPFVSIGNTVFRKETIEFQLSRVAKWWVAEVMRKSMIDHRNRIAYRDG